MQLDEALHSAIMKRVVTIQTWVKACLDRKAFLRSKESIICIQVKSVCFIMISTLWDVCIYLFVYSCIQLRFNNVHYRSAYDEEDEENV